MFRQNSFESWLDDKPQFLEITDDGKFQDAVFSTDGTFVHHLTVKMASNHKNLISFGKFRLRWYI